WILLWARRGTERNRQQEREHGHYECLAFHLTPFPGPPATGERSSGENQNKNASSESALLSPTLQVIQTFRIAAKGYTIHPTPLFVLKSPPLGKAFRLCGDICWSW